MASHQDEFDEMLKARRIEASPDLARRIILKAQNTPQLQPFSLGRWIKQTFVELHLPKPAYVLGGMLIVGFVLGSTMPFDTLPDDPDVVQVQSFLDSDEEIL